MEVDTMNLLERMRRTANSVAEWTQSNVIDQITNMQMLDEAVRIARQTSDLNNQMTQGARQAEQATMDMHDHTTDFMDHSGGMGGGMGIF
jgi:hypothetical protein